jgi:DNA-binding transcriptional ArsR family regulator
MNSIKQPSLVHDSTAAATPFAVDVRADASFELLIGLSTLTSDRAAEGGSWLPAGVAECSAGLRRAIDGVGRKAGEVWLHLLGLALESQPESAASFVEVISRANPQELRRHIVGVHVPSWRIVAGADTLERAAAGERASIAMLLEHDRYYAGRARESLELLLPLNARETKRRLLAVLRRFADEVFAPAEEDVVATLQADAEVKRSLATRVSADTLITTAARGFVYERESESSSVVLAPHLAARPWLLLCQHRQTRIICYPAEERLEAERDVRERALALGRALADEGRIEILRRLAAADASLTDLAALTGLAKSTVHHHLTQLRAGGLVVVRGNARSYRYSLRREAVDQASALVAELMSAGSA